MDNTLANKRIAKNTVFLSLRMVVVLTINLFTTRIVLQALGVVDYGVYNVVCGFVVMFSFLNTSMSNGIQRFYNYEFGKNGEEGANKVYCTSLYIQAFLAVIVVVMVEAFGLWYLHNKMVIPEERIIASEWIFQFAVISFVLGILQAPYAAAVTAHERMDFYAIISVLDAVLKLGIAYIIFVISLDHLVVYGALMAAISFVDLAIYYLYCKKKFGEILFRRQFDKQMFKSMIGFSGWNLFGSFSGVMVNQGINLVLNFYYGPIVNAARGVAMQVNGAVQSFVSNISMPVRPQVTQSYARGDIVRTMNLTYGISKISCAIVIILAVPASLEIDYLLELWLGDSIPEYTNVFTVLILLTSLVTNLNWAISGVVHATGIMKKYQIWSSLAKIGAVPLAYIAFLYFKIPILALLIVFMCEILAHVIGLFVVRRLVGLSVLDYFKRVVVPVLIVLISDIVVLSPIRLLLSEGLVRLFVLSITSLIVVCSSLFFIGLNKSERLFVKQMVMPIVKKIKAFLFY